MTAPRRTLQRAPRTPQAGRTSQVLAVPTTVAVTTVAATTVPARPPTANTVTDSMATDSTATDTLTPITQPVSIPLVPHTMEPAPKVLPRRAASAQLAQPVLAVARVLALVLVPAKTLR